MSTKLFEKGYFTVHTFYGGTERGPCLQFTIGWGAFEVIDVMNVRILKLILEEWIRQHEVDE